MHDSTMTRFAPLIQGVKLGTMRVGGGDGKRPFLRIVCWTPDAKPWSMKLLPVEGSNY